MKTSDVLVIVLGATALLFMWNRAQPVVGGNPSPAVVYVTQIVPVQPAFQPVVPVVDVPQQVQPVYVAPTVAAIPSRTVEELRTALPYERSVNICMDAKVYSQPVEDDQYLVSFVPSGLHGLPIGSTHGAWAHIWAGAGTVEKWILTKTFC